MTEPDAKQSSDIHEKIKSHKFKTLQELNLEEPEKRSTYSKPTEDQITAWIAQRPGALKEVMLKIKIGFPEICDLPVYFLAVAYFRDHVEVLNLDGRSHNFLLSEVSL